MSMTFAAATTPESVEVHVVLARRLQRRASLHATEVVMLGAGLHLVAFFNSTFRSQNLAGPIKSYVYLNNK